MTPAYFSTCLLTPLHDHCPGPCSTSTCFLCPPPASSCHSSQHLKTQLWHDDTGEVYLTPHPCSQSWVCYPSSSVLPWIPLWGINDITVVVVLSCTPHRTVTHHGAGTLLLFEYLLCPGQTCVSVLAPSVLLAQPMKSVTVTFVLGAYSHKRRPLVRPDSGWPGALEIMLGNAG